MAARSFPSTGNPGSMGSLRMKVFFLSLTISASLLLLLAVLFLLFYLYYSLFHRSRTLPFEAPPPPSKLHRFAYKELRTATRGFAAGNFVGKGGSGSVYRGVLADGKSVAVKRLGSCPSDPDREFRNETQVLGGIRSPFVVSLLGFAAEKERLFLVYEYMPNRSLQEALFGEEDDGGGGPAPLRWSHRFEIVLDVARGLKFLHSECDPPIVHGDIKPSNVLLGTDYRAKISDFGLSRLKTEGELGIDFYSQELWKSQELSGNLAALPLHQPLPSSSPKDRNFDSRASGCEKGKEVRDDDDGDVGSEHSHRAASPVDDQMSSSKKWGKDWWWRQDASGELSSRDYVMEWIGSQICPASNPDWEEDELKLDSTAAKHDSGNAMDPSEALNGAGQVGETSSAAKKKEPKTGSHRGLNKLKSNKKMKEWWKEEYFAEMSSKRADRKQKTTKSEGGRWKRRLKTMHFDLGRKVQIIRRDEGASTRHDNALYAAAADSPSFKRVWKRKKKKKMSVKSEEDLFSRELSSTTSMRGTICYVAPEYGGCGYLMEKADIYSFGVLILVIISGRRPLHVLASPMKLEQANLISWCRSLAQRGNVLELVDGRLKGEFNRDQASLCINLALMCLQKMPELRPDAGDIVRILKGEIELPTLPLECSPSPPSKLFSRSRRRGGEVE